MHPDWPLTLTVPPRDSLPARRAARPAPLLLEPIGYATVLAALTVYAASVSPAAALLCTRGFIFTTNVLLPFYLIATFIRAYRALDVDDPTE